MKSFADLKANARVALLGRYSTLIGAGLISWLISALLETPFSTMLQEGVYYTRFIRIIWGYTGMIFVSLVGALFTIGTMYMHVKAAKNNRPVLADLLFPFKNRPDKFIGCQFLLILISFVCTLPGTIVSIIAAVYTTSDISVLLIVGMALLAIGCIILIVLTISLSQSLYLLIDHPNLRVIEAMNESMRLMKGRKMRYFLLELSFIGWILLGCLTLGIGLLWILPYMTQTNTQFYLDLTQQQNEQNTYL